MRVVRPAAALGVVLACAVGSPAPTAQDTRLTVYSSLPLNGVDRPHSIAIVSGARLALAEAGGAAGPHAVHYVSLNDASGSAKSWIPLKTLFNARRAARDRSAIAYLGDFNSAASSISIPVLNEGGLAQISPSNTAIGLTRGGLGAEPGEPLKYYPTSQRQYFRLAPNDRVQGGALAVEMRDRGCTRVATLDDKEIYGTAVAAWTRRHARRLGLTIVSARRIDRAAKSHRGLARRVRRSRPDCVVFAGITANAAVDVFRAIARALPKARLFGSDGVADRGFTDPRRGGVPANVGRRLAITSPTLPPSAYPPAGRDFLRRYADRYRDPRPDPYAVYGYEAMRLVLDAVAAAGPDRQAVIDWLHSIRDRSGAVATYGFDRFGDTTTRTYGVYRIVRGELVYARSVEAP